MAEVRANNDEFVALTKPTATVEESVLFIPFFGSLSL
jgi:hypothetical protein